MLDALDLGSEEQAVYEALVDGPAQSGAALGTALGLAPAEALGIAESLESRGLVARIHGEPPRYVAINPEVALEVLLLERERRLKQARAHADQLAARFQKSDFQRATSGRDPDDLVEVLTGRPAIRRRWAQMQRCARHQMRGIDKPPYTVQRMDNAAVETEMLEAGVTYRIIYDTAGLASFHEWTDDIEVGVARGEEARMLPNTPTKLVIADERMAMLPLHAAPTEVASMIVVHPSGLLEALSALFEDLWSRALPITSPADLTVDDRPTPDEQRLLTLLATGMPDDAIAKHLGTSLRTFQRRLRSLLGRLGAETRFQAGMRATHRGWISPGGPRP